MAVNDWSDTALCTYTNVRDRYSRAGDLTGESVADDQNTEITAVIVKAKAIISKRLDDDLKRNYADADFDNDLKDNIDNPEVFKEACVAYTLMLLFEENTIDPEDYSYRQMLKFQKEYEQFYNIGVNLINYDVDESGDIEDEEKSRASGRYRIARI